jgi:hypothetical protein
VNLDEILRIGIDLPVVAILIWYTLRMQQQFNATLDKRQAMVDHLAEVVASNTQAMISVRDCLVNHEASTVPTRREATEIAQDTQYIRRKLDDHHQWDVERHK